MSGSAERKEPDLHAVPTKTLRYAKRGLERLTHKRLAWSTALEDDNCTPCVTGAAIISKAKPRGRVSRSEARKIVTEHYYSGSTARYMPGWQDLAEINDRDSDESPEQRFERVYRAVCEELKRRRG